MPIKLLFSQGTDFSLIKKLSCMIIKQNGKVLKKYTLNDIIFDKSNFIMSFPLSEKETLSFPFGKALFVCKILDFEGNVLFLKKEVLNIVQWEDDTILEDGDINV